MRFIFSQPLKTFAALVSVSVAVVAASDFQQVFMGASSAPQAAAMGSGPGLIECLTVERHASMFYNYARDLSVMHRLSDKTQNTTLLVPVDKAIIALPRRPHQDTVQEPSIDSLAAQAFDRESQSSVERFVNAHVITSNVPYPPPAGRQFSSLLGPSVSFQKSDGVDASESGWKVMPGGAKVLYTKEASNGRIFYLDGTVSY